MQVYRIKTETPKRKYKQRNGYKEIYKCVDNTLVLEGIVPDGCTVIIPIAKWRCRTNFNTALISR